VRSGRLFIAGVLGLLLIAATAFGAARFGTRSAAAPPSPALAERQSDVRFWYPAANYPRLALPGGRDETIRSVLNIRRAMKYGEFVWDEQGVSQGPLWIRADLDRQIISVFRNGHEIGTAVILYGADSKPTPAGFFPVREKSADYRSRAYDAPMPFTLMLTADGVAIHGSNVRERAATHGCIGVPLEFARRLFEQAQVGDKVYVLKSA
jgi:hypothetical protein